ncbi:hypothetical protein ABTY59_37365 [Streptomyces sp. NPDC096079]|uniref:hypothetical protein n=1 Tax=Streptomyces sp. NPDC096079 TaxID=3155820 RepID=UPI00331F55FB
MTAYSGALTRAAHFSAYTPVQGVDREHTHPDPEPDVFDPQPEGVRPAAFDVWQPEDVTVHTDMQPRQFGHWAAVRPPVGSNIVSTLSGVLDTARMVANHSQVDYRPDSYQPYKHDSQGRSIEVTAGRMPWQTGEDVPDGSAYLQAGTNAYDRTNGVKPDVYGGDQANVGRYRLGNRYEMFGLYELPGKVGQDAQLRAYTGLTPAFPMEKGPIEDPAPYTPSTRGTDTWILNPFQVPSLWSTPSETALTDHEAAEAGAYFTGGTFDDGGRL